jgi:hypothetical protein
MRLEMARSRNIMLLQRVLAKLMLLEYFRSESFRRLAEIQFAQEGVPKELRDMEALIKQEAQPQIEEPEVAEPVPVQETSKKPAKKKPQKEEPIELSSEFKLWLSDPWLKEWLSMEPSLASEDLRPYFFFSRDNLGMLGTAGQRLSLVARRVLDKLRSASDAVRISGVKEFRELGEADANAVFESLAERAKREEDLGADTASLKPLISVVAERPVLLPQLIAAIKVLPERALPVSAPVEIQNACRGNADAERAFRDVLEVWGRNTVNLSLANASRTILNLQTGKH